jgi:hypothetical protein
MHHMGGDAHNSQHVFSTLVEGVCFLVYLTNHFSRKCFFFVFSTSGKELLGSWGGSTREEIEMTQFQIQLSLCVWKTQRHPKKHNF